MQIGDADRTQIVNSTALCISNRQTSTRDQRYARNARHGRSNSCQKCNGVRASRAVRVVKACRKAASWPLFFTASNGRVCKSQRSAPDNLLKADSRSRVWRRQCQRVGGAYLAQMEMIILQRSCGAELDAGTRLDSTPRGIVLTTSRYQPTAASYRFGCTGVFSHSIYGENSVCNKGRLGRPAMPLIWWRA
ncbi:hypothetical protein L226DRAFT_334283 [Lentinus tigrinus ALCF2SS1-7]|uniref:uncharacterized protein n=1 Tax=Lentinus tigrinus ALCF2SS1-7 TaxID=1328758 RepID=UPI001165CB68|nr:hypothetical protein L226DRAFT_334283 [Lentinus tigrinus ALCF2SS1-7]